MATDEEADDTVDDVVEEDIPVEPDFIRFVYPDEEAVPVTSDPGEGTIPRGRTGSEETPLPSKVSALAGCILAVRESKGLLGW